MQSCSGRATSPATEQTGQAKLGNFFQNLVVQSKAAGFSDMTCFGNRGFRDRTHSKQNPAGRSNSPTLSKLEPASGRGIDHFDSLLLDLHAGSVNLLTGNVSFKHMGLQDFRWGNSEQIAIHKDEVRKVSGS
jgi:hypothetical protein